jgi:hypothetical protein
MRDERTLVRVKSLSIGVVEDDGNPVMGVVKVVTPAGDRVNLALTPEQVDSASTLIASLACEMMLRD